jgi:predicted nuclease of predicted toxin-antitoxin system
LLFDQNLSHHLVERLDDLYPGSMHVRELGLASASDIDVWEYGRANGFAIVSKDSDFHQRSLLDGFPPKIVWVQRGNCPTAEIEALLRSRKAELIAFEADPEGAFLELA